MKETRYTLCRRLGGPCSRSGQVRKISLSPRFDSRTVQPGASRNFNKLVQKTKYCYHYDTSIIIIILLQNRFSLRREVLCWLACSSNCLLVCDFWMQLNSSFRHLLHVWFRARFRICIWLYRWWFALNLWSLFNIYIAFWYRHVKQSACSEILFCFMESKPPEFFTLHSNFYSLPLAERKLESVNSQFSPHISVIYWHYLIPLRTVLSF